MVFSREGIIYNKANPALYASNGVQAVNSVSLKRDRIRPNKDGRKANPENSWVCRIGSEYHILPRGKKTGSSSTPNSFRMTNTEVLKEGDPLVLLEPSTVLNTNSINPEEISTISLTVEGAKDSFTLDFGSGLSNEAQVVNFIKNSPVLSSKIYAIAPETGTKVYVFAKGMEMYSISATGVTVGDPMLIPMRPIGTIQTLRTEKDNYSLVTVTPSTESNAIAVADIPTGAVIDAAVYHEVMGLFNDVIDFERISQVLVAPIHGAVGMNVFALSHFDESLRRLFPKITFVE